MKIQTQVHISGAHRATKPATPKRLSSLESPTPARKRANKEKKTSKGKTAKKLSG